MYGYINLLTDLRNGQTIQAVRAQLEAVSHPETILAMIDRHFDYEWIAALPQSNTWVTAAAHLLSKDTNTKSDTLPRNPDATKDDLPRLRTILGLTYPKAFPICEKFSKLRKTPSPNKEITLPSEEISVGTLIFWESSKTYERVRTRNGQIVTLHEAAAANQKLVPGTNCWNDRDLGKGWSIKHGVMISQNNPIAVRIANTVGLHTETWGPIPLTITAAKMMGIELIKQMSSQSGEGKINSLWKTLIDLGRTDEFAEKALTGSINHTRSVQVLLEIRERTDSEQIRRQTTEALATQARCFERKLRAAGAFHQPIHEDMLNEYKETMRSINEDVPKDILPLCA